MERAAFARASRGAAGAAVQRAPRAEMHPYSGDNWLDVCSAKEVGFPSPCLPLLFLVLSTGGIIDPVSAVSLLGLALLAKEKVSSASGMMLSALAPAPPKLRAGAKPAAAFIDLSHAAALFYRSGVANGNDADGSVSSSSALLAESATPHRTQFPT